MRRGCCGGGGGGRDLCGSSRARRGGAGSGLEVDMQVLGEAEGKARREYSNKGEKYITTGNNSFANHDVGDQAGLQWLLEAVAASHLLYVAALALYRWLTDAQCSVSHPARIPSSLTRLNNTSRPG